MLTQQDHTDQIMPSEHNTSIMRICCSGSYHRYRVDDMRSKECLLSGLQHIEVLSLPAIASKICNTLVKLSIMIKSITEGCWREHLVGSEVSVSVES